MMDQISGKVRPALIWSYVQRFAQQIVRLGIMIILARLLPVKDFGLVGMVAVLFVFTEKFIQAGFGLALVQRRDLAPEDCSTIFYFNLFLALLLYGLLFVLAPYFAAFYGYPVLTLVIRVSALKLVIDAVSSVHNVLCIREMDFKFLTITSISGTLVSGVLGVILAFSGFGVWSLVWQGIANRFVVTVLMWWLHPWKPRLVFSMASLKSHFSYGSKSTVLSGMEAIFRNIHEVVIGKFFSAVDVGFYMRGKSLQDLPFSNIVPPVVRVAFAHFAALQEDRKKLRDAFVKHNAYFALMVFPAFAGLAAVADPFIPIVFGEKWIPSIPYLQVFCVLGTLLSFKALVSTLLKSVNRVGLAIRLQLVGRLLSLAAILVTWRHGVAALIAGESLATGVALVLHYTAMKKLIPHSLYRQVLLVAPYLFCALVMGAAVYGLGQLLQLAPMLELLLQLLVGVLVYLSACMALRLPMFMEMRRYGLKAIPGVKSSDAGSSGDT